MITLLAGSKNETGTLFCRLLETYFLTLGYDKCEFDIQKSGREIDIQAQHRTEKRRLVAEAKAHAKPIGGADINKFRGASIAEEIEGEDLQISRYFVSLSGFTATAIEQERKLKSKGLTLITADDVINEIAVGGVIATRDMAIGRALGLAESDPGLGDAVATAELLAHNLGWIWAVVLSVGLLETHVALIHADGTPLDETLARGVLESEVAAYGRLRNLKYLSGPRRASATGSLNRYRRSLCDAYSELSFEGLPADENIGGTVVQLDQLYVPLDLLRKRPDAARPDLPLDEDGAPSNPRLAVGDVLSQHHRIAVLGGPGSGKSTLVKRLATRYADPSSFVDLGDAMPDRDWLPIVLRCRQIDTSSNDPIIVTLAKSVLRVDAACALEEAEHIVREALIGGSALLLVDGLDEFPNDGARMRFVSDLRALMATYPTLTVFITSREKGFRAVAPALNAVCSRYDVADLGRGQAKMLTIAWHRSAFGKTAKTDADAEKLADDIWDAPRIRALASNPLLLTTLLLVQRWVGEMPRRRSVLYSKAIEVLLMTWNVEAHDPIDQDVAVPQLAYLAFRLMQDGKKEVSLDDLRVILNEARSEMPEILGFSDSSVATFITRVEERSSLLIQTGHSLEHGQLVPVYEFKHLTFQEFLAAVAATNGYYKDGTPTDDVSEVLGPHVGETSWLEVLPLTAVLAGRRAGPLVLRLADEVRRTPARSDPLYDEVPAPFRSLWQSLVDEAQLSPTDAATAVDAVIMHWVHTYVPSLEVAELMSCKYGELFQERLIALARRSDVSGEVTSLLSSYVQRVHVDVMKHAPEALTTAISLMNDDDQITRVQGALIAMNLGFEMGGGRLKTRRVRVVPKRLRQGLVDGLSGMLYSNEPIEQMASSWAFAWLSEVGLRLFDDVSLAQWKDLTQRMFLVWRHTDNPSVARFGAWAFWTLPRVDVAQHPLGSIRGHTVFLRKAATSLDRHQRYGDIAIAALVASTYFGVPVREQARLLQNQAIAQRQFSIGRRRALADWLVANQP
jgi:hypothetical protein